MRRHLIRFKEFIFHKVSKEHKTQYSQHLYQKNITRTSYLSLGMLAFELIVQMLALWMPSFQNNNYHLPIAVRTIFLIVLALYCVLLLLLQKIELPTWTGMVVLHSFLANIFLFSLLSSTFCLLHGYPIFPLILALLGLSILPCLSFVAWCMYVVPSSVMMILLNHAMADASMYAFTLQSIIATILLSLLLWRWFSYQEHTAYSQNKFLTLKNISLFHQIQKLEELSTTDPLTGLGNRRAFEQIVHTIWEQCKREELPVSIIMMDIDFFKKYNDQWGHMQGDVCLMTVAKSLQNSFMRKSDLLIRYGGEEFLAMLPSSSLENTLLLAERARQRIEELLIFHKDGQLVTMSFGVATTIPQLQQTYSQLILVADQALYFAKDNGRNRVEHK